jgi:hypothetical protein
VVFARAVDELPAEFVEALASADSPDDDETDEV